MRLYRGHTKGTDYWAHSARLNGHLCAGALSANAFAEAGEPKPAESEEDQEIDKRKEAEKTSQECARDQTRPHAN